MNAPCLSARELAICARIRTLSVGWIEFKAGGLMPVVASCSFAIAMPAHKLERNVNAVVFLI